MPSGAALDLTEEFAYGADMEGPYRVYFDRVPVPIAAVDGLGRVRDANPAFRLALARTAEELDGLHAEELLAEGELEVQRPYWLGLALGRLDGYRSRMRLVRGDGAVIHARVSARVEPRANGLPWRAVAVLDEICPVAEALSPLQGEVLRLVAVGASNAQIARRLHLTRQAVDYHLVRLRARLGADSRSALAGRAFVLGLFVPGTWPPQLRVPAGTAAPEQDRAGD